MFGVIGVWSCIQIQEYSKSPCPCRNHTFPNLVHHQNLESTHLQEPRSFQKLHISQWGASSWHGKHKDHDPEEHQDSHAEIAHFCTPFFCITCVLDKGYETLESVTSLNQLCLKSTPTVKLSRTQTIKQTIFFVYLRKRWWPSATCSYWTLIQGICQHIHGTVNLDLVQ